MSDERLNTLGELSQFEVKAPGETVCHEGELGDRVYVVIYGTLNVHATTIDPKTKERTTLMLSEVCSESENTI